jgi:hypothetical protein
MKAQESETSLLTEQQLDAVAGGRVCNQNPPRMTVEIAIGGRTLVIWATAGCSDAYFK